VSNARASGHAPTLSKLLPSSNKLHRFTYKLGQECFIFAHLTPPVEVPPVSNFRCLLIPCYINRLTLASHLLLSEGEILPDTRLRFKIKVAVLDNYFMNGLPHCFNCANCRCGFGLVKRHSHSFKKSGKCWRGTPWNLRMCRVVWF